MSDQNTQKGMAAYGRGDYETAHQEFLKAAEQGDAWAQTALGQMHFDGHGVPKDDAEALCWFRKAAEQDNATAQNNLGWMYQAGQGVPKDYAEAACWYRKAAEQGNARAQNNLGWMYQVGQGIPKDAVEAVRCYRKSAEQGNATAQFNLGVMYHANQGVPKDDAESALWYRKAAKQGHSDAQFNLGLMYAKGEGVPKDDAEAALWYRKAAKQGHTKAQFNLGLMYAKGEGVPKDSAEAAHWYRKAAKQGHTKAQFRLSRMYYYGEGLPKDDAEAAHWARKAAEQGCASAQSALGGMYAIGEGVSRDYIEAYKWFNIAAAQGLENTATALDELQRNMTPSQIAQAQARTREWRPSSGSDAPSSEETMRSVAPRETAPWVIGTPPNDIGSGFFVSAEHILTNNHVIENCSWFRILPNNSDAIVRARDPANDLALLQLLRSSPGRCEQPAILRSEGARQGENVVAAGYPLHELLRGGMKVTQGIVSALSGVNGDTRHLQITAPVQESNSGGPLLDGSGHVLGVVVEALPTRLGGKTPQNVNFAIRAEIVRVFLDAYYVPYQTARPSTALSTEQIAAKARACTVRIECWEEKPETGK